MEHEKDQSANRQSNGFLKENTFASVGFLCFAPRKMSFIDKSKVLTPQRTVQSVALDQLVKVANLTAYKLTNTSLLQFNSGAHRHPRFV